MMSRSLFSDLSPLFLNLHLEEKDSRQESFDFSVKTPLVYQVSDLVKKANQVLGDQFSQVLVEGEVDGCKAHSNGHLYFTLKDETTVISVTMWRTHAQKVYFALRNGMKIRALGRVGIYESQGKLQFYVEEIFLHGEGEKKRAYDELKQKLYQEGLFSSKRKRAIPAFPRRVGIVTSLDGAVLHDILQVAQRRGRVHFLLAPCLVQGEGASFQICHSLKALQSHVDVIILARGGGASSDLAVFNEEIVVRAIAQSSVPVVSAIGHEVDMTLADFAADFRAPTPSAAAECVVPHFATLEEELQDLNHRLLYAGQRVKKQAALLLQAKIRKLQQEFHSYLSRKKEELHLLTCRLQERHPQLQFVKRQAEWNQLLWRLRVSQNQIFSLKRKEFEQLIGKLQALSPLHVLSRGYALAQDDQGHVLTSPNQVNQGDAMTIRLHQGEVLCQVVATKWIVPKDSIGDT